MNNIQNVKLKCSNRCGRDGYNMLLDIMQGPDGYKFDGVSSPEGYNKGLVRRMVSVELKIYDLNFSHCFGNLIEIFENFFSHF
jgi:hypothetical protein